MTDQKITKYVADWFARADEDLDVAQLILGEERPYNPACFHEQQAAEKYLKGFLAHHEKHARKIHDLDALLQECIKIDQSFESLQDSTRFLSRFYVESRYPDDYIEFTREDAEKGLEAALRIKEFVLAKIKRGNDKGFGIVGIILIIAAVAVLGGGFLYLRELIKQPAPPAPSVGFHDSWKTYHDEKYGFEVKYPPSFSEWKGEPQNSTIIGIPEQSEYIFIQIPGDEGNRGKNCEDYTLAGQKFQWCEIKVEVGGFMTDDGILNWTEKSILVKGIHQGQLLIIRFQAKEDRTDLFQTFEAILSTFKFIK